VLDVDPRTAGQRRLYPSVSLLVPVDGSTPWQQRLEALEREAATRLLAEFGPSVDRALLGRLSDAVAGATVPAGARGLAVYVNAQGAGRVGVSVAVRERVVIDDTFATRDLVRHELRSPRYWLLAVSLDEPRLLRGLGASLHPHPLPLADPEPPDNGRDRRGWHPGEIAELGRARRLRALDDALGEAMAGTSDPVIVMGAEPTVSRFLDRTRHIAKVHVALRRAAGDDLATVSRTVAPAVAHMLARRRAVALDALGRAVGAGVAACGMEAVWLHARRGGGGLLVVEEGFEHPGVIAADGSLAQAADTAGAGVVDDAVDDAIELVLASGGRVEFVPDGALAPHGRIAFVAAPRRR
jgi:hypothetical protein